MNIWSFWNTNLFTPSHPAICANLNISSFLNTNLFTPSHPAFCAKHKQKRKIQKKTKIFIPWLPREGKKKENKQKMKYGTNQNFFYAKCMENESKKLNIILKYHINELKIGYVSNIFWKLYIYWKKKLETFQMNKINKDLVKYIAFKFSTNLIK